MITSKNLKTIVKTIRENHGSYAKAAQVTGISQSYFSRVSSGDLAPRSIHNDIAAGLAKGLTPSQRKKLMADPDQTKFDAPLDLTDQDIKKWIAALTPVQREALVQLMAVFPG
jgi:hypothetical protein